MSEKTKFIIANWKMNGSQSMLEEWVNTLFKNSQQNDLDYDKVDVVLCAPNALLDRASLMSQTYNAENDMILNTGAQDTHYEESGAYTGDTSATLVRELGGRFTIIGHSERRKNHQETNEMVNKKVTAALNAGLTPVLCIGESEEVRDSGKQNEFIERQILESLPENADVSKVVIAYEPIWAIGTGKTSTSDQIEEMSSHIKYVVAKNRKISENNINVLYGGSVKPDNAKEIMSIEDVDGVLVGGASLDPDKFFGIIKGGM